jgi:predicted MPP superfamily phosphohydrolase
MTFFLFALAGFAMMYGYIGWRLIPPAGFSTPVSAFLWSALVVLVTLPFFPIVMRMNNIEGRWVEIIAWIGYLSFGFLTILFAALVVKDLGYSLTIGAQKVLSLFGSAAESAAVDDPERRRAIVNMLNIGALGVAGAMTAYGLYEALRKPEIVNVRAPITGLPESLEGFRIVQITDIHVSHTIRRPFVEAVVATVNGLKPDLVALTGDLVDGTVEQLSHDVAPLAELNAPHGLYFITGNHEYYSGVRDWVVKMRELGFRVLLNEHDVIEHHGGRLLMAGVTDYSGGQFSPDHASDPHRAIDGAPTTDVRILLAHQPKSIFEAAKAGYDLVISGHTHGGQYFPYHFLTALAQPYMSGLHRHEDTATQIYVSRGTGYWGPQIRIGARSEITVLTLTRA